MKKMIIPRRDHEVYFIPRPGNLKTRQLRPFVVEQLDRLHPGFSAEFSVDLKQFAFNNMRWIMATVMKTETLSEYKILHPGAAFYTNTSAAVYKKGFLHGGINTIDDERIGFNTEINSPVSVPIKTNNGDGFPALRAKLMSVPSRHGVFAEKISKWRVTAMVSGLMAMVLLSSAFNLAKPHKSSGGEETFEAPQFAELTEETKYLPSSMEMLAAFSADLAAFGGKMTRWQYNEDFEPLLTMQMRGVDALTAHKIGDQYKYAEVQDIREVRYGDGEPLVTICLNTARAGYAVLNAGAFPAQNVILPVIADFTNELLAEGIAIVSETLPTADSGSYTITYNARGRNLPRSLEIIAGTCEACHLRVKSLDVSINGDYSLFTVICTLTRGSELNFSGAEMADKRNLIPAAFGYREKLPASAGPNTNTAAVKAEPPIIGSILDGTGKTIFFRDVGDGKIKTRRNR